MQAPENIANLLFKWVRNELTFEEEMELKEWRESSPDNEALFIKLSDPDKLRGLMQDYYSYKEKAWNKLLDKAPELRGSQQLIKPGFRWKRLIAAASFLVIVAGGLYLLLRHPHEQLIAKQSKPLDKDIPPGTNKAILTLADGSKLILDSTGNGQLPDQGNSKLVKLDSGSLAYSPLGQQESGITLYNILSTPRGGQFQLILPDGTKVWLNASTTLRYPTSFSGKERKVELSGEAYLEVSKDLSKPFKLEINHEAEVQVLGTHLNIMADTDEQSIATTLLEGRVKMIKGLNAETIVPGEQAIALNNSDRIQVVRGIDLNAVVAWKNGRTFFKNADTRSIMRMISRWYDVDVEYQGNPPAERITGGISRAANLSELLKVLELNGIHVTREGKILTVMP
jgi:transmembrane sensor